LKLKAPPSESVTVHRSRDPQATAVGVPDTSENDPRSWRELPLKITTAPRGPVVPLTRVTAIATQLAATGQAAPAFAAPDPIGSGRGLPGDCGSKPISRPVIRSTVVQRTIEEHAIAAGFELPGVPLESTSAWLVVPGVAGLKVSSCPLRSVAVHCVADGHETP
jgi:hypothetical protein